MLMNRAGSFNRIGDRAKHLTQHAVLHTITDSSTFFDNFKNASAFKQLQMTGYNREIDRATLGNLTH